MIISVTSVKLSICHKLPQARVYQDLWGSRYQHYGIILVTSVKICIYPKLPQARVDQYLCE